MPSLKGLRVSLMICLSFLSLVGLMIPVHATLSLDGSAEASFTAGYPPSNPPVTTNVTSIALTTTHPKDLIVIGVIFVGVYGTNVTSITDTNGLVYILRARFVKTAPSCLTAQIEEWYSFAENSMPSDVITVRLSSSHVGISGVIGWGIAGSSRTSFDRSPSFPGLAVETDCSHEVSTAFTTHSSNDFVFGLFAINDGGENPALGFTSLSGGSFGGFMDMMYTVASRPLANSSASFNGDAMAMIIDAVQLAGPF